MGNEAVGITLIARDMASGAIANVRKELQGLGGAGGIASAGIGAASKIVSGASGAMSHFAGVVKGLVTGPLGLLGLGAGVFSVFGALKSGIDTASNMALSIEKLTGLTGESAQAMSGLLAVFQKFNISGDTTAQVVGFAEKTLGKLAATTPVSTAKVNSATQGVTKATEALSLAQMRLAALEAKGKASAEQLAAARDAVTNATMNLQNAQAKLATAEDAGSISTSKLAALDKRYGLQLIDSTGHVVDFTTELKQVADYYTSSASASDKAAVAAQLFGRGYAQLIPILSLGSKGIDEAEQAAQALGLTLTEQNVTDLKDYQETMRNLGDAVGGLQLQLSLALVPAIQDVASAATSFIADNRQSIIGFFQDLIADSRTAAAFITGTIVPDIKSLAGAALGFWNSIPPQLRDLLVKGFVADKAIKFLFGFDPATTIGSIITGAISKGFGNAVSNAAGNVAGGLLARGSSPANPLWVQMVGGGGGGIPGGPAGAAEDAAAGGGLLAAGTLATGIAAILGAYWLPQILANENGKGAQGTTVTGSRGQNFGSLTWQQVGTSGLGNLLAAQNAATGSGTPLGNDLQAIKDNTDGLVGATGNQLQAIKDSTDGLIALTGAAQKAAGWTGSWSKALQDQERQADRGFVRGTRDKNLAKDAGVVTDYWLSVSSAYFTRNADAKDHLDQTIDRLKTDETAAVREGDRTLADKLQTMVGKLETLKNHVTVNVTTQITNATVAKGQQTMKVYGSQIYVE